MQAQTTDIKAQSIYDVNQDDKVAVSDVTAVVNRIKVVDDASFTEKTVVDTQKLIELLTSLNEQLSEIKSRLNYIEKSGVYTYPFKNCHEYVDLGLPSGLLWATCNVGANSPSEYGDYFAWGETTGYNSGKTSFTWSTYKLCNGSKTTVTRYCTNSSYGTVDGKTILDAEDDAAAVNWGSDWRMPTLAEQNELRDKCTWTWTEQDGVNGYKITGSNGNFIFLPAAGTMPYGDIYPVGSYGFLLVKHS